MLSINFGWDFQTGVMRLIHQAFLILFTIVTAAILAGCGSSANTAAGADSALRAAGQHESKPQMATPYSQPLMATGGDLVMLDGGLRGIAG